MMTGTSTVSSLSWCTRHKIGTTRRPVDGHLSARPLPAANSCKAHFVQHVAVVLRDDVLDRRLHRDGFVVLPLVDPAVVSRLRDAFGSLRGWEGEGFQSEWGIPDPELRRSVSSTIGEALDHYVTPLFKGYKPFVRTFACSFPGHGRTGLTGTVSDVPEPLRSCAGSPT